MRLSRGLDDVLASKAKLRLLRELSRDPPRDLTGRELARAADLSASRASIALEEMRRTGIVDRRLAGRAMLWYLCEEHVLHPELVRLFGTERSLIQRLVEDLRQRLRGLPVRSVRLFGSVARGTERPDSDIDLFVEVGSDRDRSMIREKVADLWLHGARVYGNPISAIVLTTAERKKPSNPKLIADIIREGIPVIGG